MTRPHIPASVRVAALLSWTWLAGACSAADPPARVPEPGVGETLPAIGLSGERAALVWVLAAEQCLGCELGDPARVVRALQLRLGERIETVVVAVGSGGDEDQRLVVDFLASQRISATVQTRTRDRHRQDFGSAGPSVLYVANREAVIEAAIPADSAGTWRSPGVGRDLVGFVEDVANQGPASKRAP